MEAKDVFSLGLGLSEPWKLSGQRLDVIASFAMVTKTLVER